MKRTCMKNGTYLCLIVGVGGGVGSGGWGGDGRLDQIAFFEIFRPQKSILL